MLRLLIVLLAYLATSLVAARATLYAAQQQQKPATKESHFYDDLFGFNDYFPVIFQWERFEVPQLPAISSAFVDEIARVMRSFLKLLQRQSATLFSAASEELEQRKKPVAGKPSHIAFPLVLLKPLGNFTFNFGFNFNFASSATFGLARTETFQLRSDYFVDGADGLTAEAQQNLDNGIELA